MISQDGTARRPLPARIGIAALNLLHPGLGLLRLGNWRGWLGFLAAQFALLALVSLAMGHAPIASHSAAVSALVVLVALVSAIYFASIVLTWRQSAIGKTPRAWARWYAIIAACVVVIAMGSLASGFARSFYRPFYLPTQSMRPTLAENDRIIADMRWRGPYRRGQTVLFRHRDQDWIKRIVALPGDRIAFRKGVPVVNGETAIQTRTRAFRIEDEWGGENAIVYRERLPGEAGTHEVMDTALTPSDDFAEMVVPAGHVFVVGDNRDHSADSRHTQFESGTGPVPVTAIIGRPLYISWGIDRARTGTRLDR